MYTRTAAKLPLPELPNFRRAPPAGAAGLPPEFPLFHKILVMLAMLARLVTVGGVLSEMHLTQNVKKFFQSLHACGSTRDPKQHPQIPGKVLFS